MLSHPRHLNPKPQTEFQVTRLIQTGVTFPYNLDLDLGEVHRVESVSIIGYDGGDGVEVRYRNIHRVSYLLAKKTIKQYQMLII